MLIGGTVMGRMPAERVDTKPPEEFDWLFAEPPLLGSESIEDYLKLRDHLAYAAKPTNLIQWMLLKDYADLTFDIWRERKAKAAIIELKQKEVVLDLLKSTYDGSDAEAAHYRIFTAADDAQKWASNPEKRAEIDAVLAKRGHLPSAVQAQAFINGAAQIDAIDKRIATYELRRLTAYRELERIGDRLAQRLEKAATEFIEGEFSEAAE